MDTERRIRHAAGIPPLMLRYLQRTLPEASELPLRQRMPLVTVWETERFDGFTAYNRSRLWYHIPLAQAVTPADTARADFRPDGMIGTIELRSRSAGALGRITFSRYAQVGGVFLPARARAYRDLLQPYWQATICQLSLGC